MRRSARIARAEEERAPPTPSPPPKKPKKTPYKERPRPEVAYELVHDVPVSTEEPNFDLLKDPLSFEASKSFAYSLYVSRNNWLSGTMFETIWTRKPRGRKLEAGEVNARDRMSRLGECTMVMGPHIFPAKLFIVKDEEEETVKKEDEPKAEETKAAEPKDTESAEPEKPQPNPNQLLVQKLQEMAKEDPKLDELMKLVASGKATPEDMTSFQQYMAKVRAETARKSPAPVYTPRRTLRSTSLAFELLENPQERYLLPKKAVVEVLPDGDILWSFLHVFKDKDGEVWTPTTVVLQDVPDRMISTIDGCVEKYDKVVEAMKETMASGKRAEDQYVWYQIDKGDYALLEEIKKTASPMQHVLPSKRQPKLRATPAGGALDGVKEESSGTPRERAPKQPRLRHTTYPAVPTSPVNPQAPAIAPLPPKLQLPDINSFFIPPGGLPPLPPSLANSFAFPPIPGGPTAPTEAKKEDEAK